MKNRHQQSVCMSRGFSLVEMVVALGIFALVSTIALGAYLKIMDANSKAQSIKTAVNNINFALEAMSREIRVGTRLYCGELTTFPDLTNNRKITPTGCSGGNTAIAFHSSNQILCNGNLRNAVYAYKFENGKLHKAEQASCVATSPSWYPITSNDVIISNPRFYVTLEGPTGSPRTGRMLMTFTGEAGIKEKVKTVFDVQTTVAQRLGN